MSILKAMPFLRQKKRSSLEIELFHTLKLFSRLFFLHIWQNWKVFLAFIAYTYSLSVSFAILRGICFEKGRFSQSYPAKEQYRLLFILIAFSVTVLNALMNNVNFNPKHSYSGMLFYFILFSRNEPWVMLRIGSYSYIIKLLFSILYCYGS